jgi:hypothetical protein
MDDIGRQRVELTKRELGRFRGESFDRAFLQHQIVAHMYSLSLIRGVKGHVGSELQEMLDEAEDSNWSHLSRAKEVLHEMELVPSQVTR